MNVYEFCFLAVESSEVVTIWSSKEQKYVFEGTYQEAMNSKYNYMSVGSFGLEGGIICINI